MENTTWLILIVIVVCFYAGFRLVDFFIKKINGRSAKNNEDFGYSYEQQYSQKYNNQYQNERMGSFPYTQSGEDPKERHYALVLGLHGRISTDEIRMHFKDLIAKYHPDKVQHLGNEFKEMAELKTVEILEAYRYFQKKYNIK